MTSPRPTRPLRKGKLEEIEMVNESPEKTPPQEDLFVKQTAEEIVEACLYETDVKVVGVGGCGCNTVDYIAQQEMNNVKTIGINTDERVLNDLDLDTQMLIGKEITDKKGAEGDPKVGKRAAELSEEDILDTLDGADFVVIVAGLGGGTGSGASRVITDLARRNGKMVVTYAIMPFSVEKERYDRAEKALDKLSKLSHATTVFENDKALEFGDKTPQQAFRLADKTLHQVVKHLQMEQINQFFEEMEMDPSDLKKTVSTIEEEKEEDQEEHEERKPKVLEALEYVEEDEDQGSPAQHEEKDRMNSFLDNYQ